MSEFHYPEILRISSGRQRPTNLPYMTWVRLRTYPIPYATFEYIRGDIFNTERIFTKLKMICTKLREC